MPGLHDSLRSGVRKRARRRTPDGNRRPADYRSIAGAFIHNLADWSVFATLTFSRKASDSRADAALLRWLRKLAKEAIRDHVTVAWAFDYQAGGFPHFHALLAFPTAGEEVSVQHEWLGELWRQSDSAAGFFHFRHFDHDKGAAWYLAEHAQWAVGVVCPRRPRCRRKKGCRVTIWPL